MALTTREKAALAGFGINEALLKGQGIGARSIKAIGKAAVKLSPFVARAAVPAARTAAGVAGSLAAANPISTGLGLGLGFTQTPQGQALLETAAERGAADRVRAQQIYDQMVYENITRPAGIVQETLTQPRTQQMVKKAVKRKVSRYSRAVKLGMAAVKQSNYLGKKGVISNPKSAFSTVSKVASSINKGRKRPTKGIRGTIARAIKGEFK